ncbi:ComF family protein [Candidatus Contendibacter odensensis]|uniref:Competence protein F n=1 Tax=Candidatus Contendobacter odensis Run_B_J11 TaxID=1400861 RepID=A0A7U7J3A2_9GAMM|nr:ComF family protein [Candidatus Contendobacter odensis]CDH45029.1 Competence protein F [Candidatus Contendobacter odensis Run_B_J11]
MRPCSKQPAHYPSAAPSVATTWWNPLQRGLLPSTCLLCGADGTGERDLCAGCAADLPRNSAACPRCAAPLPVSVTGLCDSCHASPPNFDRAFVPFRYQPPLDALIKHLKFGGRLAHARLLGDLFAAALAERAGSLPDCIVPVPLHPQRLRERGFNQALELARTTARRFQIPLRATGLRRVRYTLPQTQLDARRRQTNPLGAFALGDPLAGSRVALMDDVITTASTITECARVLRTGGATEIELWAIGRAVVHP